MRGGALLTVVALLACGSHHAHRDPLVAERASAGVDCHLHVPPDAVADPVAATLAALDEAGLERGCWLSGGLHVAPGCVDRTCDAQRAFTERSNDVVIALAGTSGGRLMPFCGVPITAPFAPDEVDRCALAGGRGLKLHLVNERVFLTDPAQAEVHARFDEVLARAGRRGLPVLVHLQMDDADEVRAFFSAVARQPLATVIAAHQIAPHLALLPEAPANLWIELSGLTHAPVAAGQVFVPVWRRFGVDRILLGSDFPQLSPAAHVAMLRAYPLTEAERTQIVSGNATRLFGPPLR